MLARREAGVETGLGLGVDELQPSAGEVAPGVALKVELDGRRATGEPEAARHPSAGAVVDLAAEEVFVDAPGHAGRLREPGRLSTRFAFGP